MAVTSARLEMIRPLNLLAATLLALFIASLFTGTPTEAEAASIVEEIKGALGDVSCPEKYKTELVICAVLAFPYYGMEASFESNITKYDCCVRLAHAHCLQLIAKVHCGNVAQVLTSFKVAFSKMAASSECLAYNTVDQCSSPIMQFVVNTIIFSIILSIVFGCCRYCCYCCFR